MGTEKLHPDAPTSLEKALDVCEALAGAGRGLSVTELGRALRLPTPTVHRLLGVLKRRGFVRQDEDTSKYSLTLKMLDLSFRLLGRSELRLHAYPVLREYVLRTGLRAFIAAPAGGEVTYLWSAGPDDVGMHTAYGRQMPVHCAVYLDAAADRRLTCLRLEQARDALHAERIAVRFGRDVGDAARPPIQRLLCTCAPVHDYTGREVARVGVFQHAAAERPFVADQTAAAAELARLISVRLGCLSAVTETNDFIGVRRMGRGSDHVRQPTDSARGPSEATACQPERRPTSAKATAGNLRQNSARRLE